MSSAVWQQNGDSERPKQCLAIGMSWVCEQRCDTMQTRVVRPPRRSSKERFQNVTLECGEACTVRFGYARSKIHSAEDDVKKEPWSPRCIDGQSQTPSTIIQVLGRSPPNPSRHVHAMSDPIQQKEKKPRSICRKPNTRTQMPCYVTSGLYVYAKQHSHVLVMTVIASPIARRRRRRRRCRGYRRSM